MNKQPRLPVLALAVLFAAVLPVARAAATPSSGASVSVLADGNLAAPLRARFMDASPPVQLPEMGGHGFGAGTEVQHVRVAKFAAEPGGHFGWHQHSGPIWLVITAGTLTLYSGDDPQCRPQTLPTGSAFLEGADHTHIARNETDKPVEGYAVYMLPAGGAPRVDVANPGNCPF